MCRSCAEHIFGSASSLKNSLRTFFGAIVWPSARSPSSTCFFFLFSGLINATMWIDERAVRWASVALPNARYFLAQNKRTRNQLCKQSNTFLDSSSGPDESPMISSRVDRFSDSHYHSWRERLFLGNFRSLCPRDSLSGRKRKRERSISSFVF